MGFQLQLFTWTEKNKTNVLRYVSKLEIVEAVKVLRVWALVREEGGVLFSLRRGWSVHLQFPPEQTVRQFRGVQVTHR